MAKLSTVFVILLHLVFLQKIPTSTAQVHPYDLRRIHPSQISTITLVAGAHTTSRKAHYIKQIQCFGSYCHAAQVLKATCRNTGFDGYDIQWACDYSVTPQGYKVSRFTINCEGYDSKEDVYIVEGSCGLEYKLAIASSFEKYEMGEIGWQILPIVFVVLIFIIALVLIVTVCVIYGPGSTRVYRGYDGYDDYDYYDDYDDYGYGGRTTIGRTRRGTGGGVTTGTAYGGTTRRGRTPTYGGGATTGTAFGGTTRRGRTPTYGGGIGGTTTGTAFGGTKRR